MADWKSRSQVVEPDAAPVSDWKVRSKTKEAPGAFRSGVLGFAQGGTSGFADEIGGAIGKLLLNGSGVSLGPNASQEMRDFEAARPTDYQMTRDLIRDEAKVAKEVHPETYYPGEIGGGIAQTIAMPGKTPKGLGGVMKQGAIYGGASGLGGSNSDSLGGMVGDTALGAGSGAALAAMLYGAGRGARALLSPKSALERFAAERAIKATGAIQSDIKGIPPERLQEMGSQLLRNDVISMGGKGDINRAATEGAERAGSLIGSTLEQADEAAKAAKSGFEWNPVLQKVQQKYESQDPIARDAASGAYEQALRLAESAREGAGFARANQLKGSIQKTINWRDAGAKIPNETKKAVQGILDDEIEKQLVDRVGGEGAQQFKTAKSLYGTMKFAQDASRRGMERSTGNNLFSLPDVGAAAGELSGSGGDLLGGGKAAATLLLAKALRERGNAGLALGANKLAPYAYRGLEGVSTEALAPVLGRYGGIGARAGFLETPEPDQKTKDTMALIEALRARGQ